MHAPVRIERPISLRRFMGEPLVHFLLIGLLLFVAYGFVRSGNGDREIVVGENVNAALFAQFQTARQRPPTAQEMNALVESYVRDEIFYREGVALGLERDDPTIKRRIAQKFATLAEESEAAEPPSDADLERWLKEHPTRYAEPQLVSFNQISFGSAAAAEAARKSLAAGADPNTLGTGRMLLPRYDMYPLDLVEREFGAAFARALVSGGQGRWQGPVRSGYGMHLVKVDKVIPSRIPTLSEVRGAVARDFEQDRRTKALDAAYRTLREKYRIELAESSSQARPE